jgi:hypothetical protein
LLDNTLIALIISTLTAGEATAGIPGLPLKQAFQPTQQGVNTQPTAYLYKIGDRRYGFTRRSDEWDSQNSRMVHTEIQQYETTFQLSALATQDPKTPTQYTASDILNLCASILQSSVAIQTFESHGVGIERVTDVRNPYVLDDRAQFEASPSFDFIMTHKQIITSYTPVITGTELQILTV